jgi:hypothetical protein
MQHKPKEPTYQLVVWPVSGKTLTVRVCAPKGSRVILMLQLAPSLNAAAAAGTSTLEELCGPELGAAGGNGLREVAVGQIRDLNKGRAHQCEERSQT